MRFSPQTQQPREDAIDSMVERILDTAPKDKYYLLRMIQKLFSESAGFHVTYNTIHNSLERLREKGRAEVAPEERPTEKLKVKGIQKRQYRLTANAKKELLELENASTRRFKSVVKRLFRDSEHGPEAYEAPFLKFLTLIFSRLAEEYTQVLTGEIKGEDFATYPIFSSTLHDVKGELKSLDLLLFESAVESFFRDTDPDYSLIKWNLVQNYYILRLIGKDDISPLLSKEIFGNAVFYLDTNVVISALAAEEEHHLGFVALSKACEKIGVKIKVCNITFDELDRTVEANRGFLQSAVDQIPEETAVKVTSAFYKIYHEKKKAGKELDLDEVFGNFISAREILRKLFQIEVEDDYWFEEAINDEKTKAFAEIVGQRYSTMRPRKKHDLACVHDALCLMWVDYCKNQGQNAWFVTRDYTLPACIPPDCSAHSLAIGLDALLQWLSPITLDDDMEKDLALAYSQIISNRILPQEKIFSLEDFVIFKELDMQCKELPAEDVEGCIRHIKVNAPLLDPTDPRDREKLAHEVAVYFVDPSRKYKQTVQDFESEISEVKRELREATEQSLRQDALIKLNHVLIGLTASEATVMILAIIYGAGANIYQNIIGFWPFFGTAASGCLVAGGFYIGRKRLKALGWPWTKIFKSE